MYLLAELLEDPSIDDFLAPHMQQLMQLFTSSLTDQQSSQIRKNALRAISNHASNFSEESDTAMIVSIIPSITHVLSEAINEKDNELIVSGV